MSMKILMCPPDYFSVDYEINPWMHVDNPAQPLLAKQQWQALFDTYISLGYEVLVQPAIEGLPDMVFTANGGLVIDGKVALPKFRQADRQGETIHDREWFMSNGFKDILETKYEFEGEGDALLMGRALFAGYPWRSDKPSHKELSDFFNIEVVSVQLADARFYHLDTCLTIIDHETVALYPKAFTPESLELIKSHAKTVIYVDDNDAVHYGLNAFCVDKTIVMPAGATNLVNQYRGMGLNVIETDISEFQKSGGGVKCLTLEIRE